MDAKFALVEIMEAGANSNLKLELQKKAQASSSTTRTSRRQARRAMDGNSVSSSDTSGGDTG